MQIEQVIKLSSFDQLVYWISEREAIRGKKERQSPKPWTDDEILQSFRFCNVRRMDDTVSQWLYTNWYGPYRDHPNMLVACTLARFFNLPEALQEIGFPERWDAKDTRKRLRKMKTQGKRVFNSAYMVRGNDGIDKIACVINFTVQKIARSHALVNNYSMEKTWARLVPIRGMGPFMAGQVVADLRWAVRGAWLDRDQWGPMGPGSRRGMARLIKGEKRTNVTNQAGFNFELMALIAGLKRRLSGLITDRLEAIDYQNCLCEYDKYKRTLHGEGKPKRRYPGV